MEINVQSSQKSQYLFICGISATIVIIGSSIYLHYERTKYWPPKTKHGIFQTLVMAVQGKFPVLLLENCREIGPIFRAQFPTWECVTCICDAALARKLLEQDSKKSKGYYRFKKLTFDRPNIISKNTLNDGWEWARKAVAPSFSNTNLYKAMPKLNLRLNELLVILDKFCETSTNINISEVLLKFTFNFIAASMFDVDYNITIDNNSHGTPNEGSDFLHEIHIAIFEQFQGGQQLRIDKLWNGEPARARLATVRMREYTQKILDNYRASHTPEEAMSDSSILAHLIRSPYEDDEARCADMIVFLIAGHDTTAYTLAWTIIELSRNPEVVRLLREELDACMAGNNTSFGESYSNSSSAAETVDSTSDAKRTATPASSSGNSNLLEIQRLHECTYLTAVIKESMRLWPVVATGSGREFDEDICVGNYVIPKNSSVIFPFFALFRHGIKNPDVFEPDRWIRQDEDTNLLKTMFMPFSAGRRVCVGQNLAMLELKLVLSALVRRYDMKLLGEITMNSYLTLKPENSIFEFVRRK